VSGRAQCTSSTIGAVTTTDAISITVSASVTDTLTLHASHGLQFTVGNDGHGGTKITLPHLLAGGTLASFFSDDAGVEHWTSDAIGNGDHMADYLFVV
jgi:hypothetical protein